jgi:hypothetical protein
LGGKAVESWSFIVVSTQPGVQAVYTDRGSGNVTRTHNWDGKDKNGKVVDGTYIAKFEAKLASGATVTA